MHVGRIFLALYFLIPGISKFTSWNTSVALMEAHNMKMIPALLTIAGIAQVVGSISLLLNRHVVICALGFAVMTLLINFNLHDFWNIYEGGMADRETWKAEGNTENLGWDWSITLEGYLRLSKGDDFVRLIAPYFKGEYGAAVIIFDEYADTSMNEMWSTYFVDTVDLYIPPQPE